MSHALTASETELLLSGLPVPPPRASGRGGDEVADAPGRRLESEGWNRLLSRFLERFCPVLGELVRTPLVPVECLPGEPRGAGGVLWGELEPLDEPLGLEFDAELLFPLLNRLLGGDATNDERDAHQRARVLGPMERRLIERVGTLAAQELCFAFRDVLGVPLISSAFVWRADEGDERRGPGGVSKENRLRARIQGGGLLGGMTWWIPEALVNMLNPGETHPGSTAGRAGGDGGSLGADEVEAVAVIGELELEPAEWEELSVGDVIVLGEGEQTEVLVELADGKVLRGEGGVWEGRKAVRIVAPEEGVRRTV
ncbi:MAG: FliM/FliN family flagellar motor C-terminal domain-containing protein [Planctomycetota bacterium]|nr:FliM/FliN family flagellar motor C-terminal domain-containing protein [Planctomycetota bacterium]